MSMESRKSRRHRSEFKLNIMLPVVCLLILGFAMCTNYIGKNYITKANELKEKINLSKTESSTIKSDNISIEQSISELDKLIETIKTELN